MRWCDVGILKVMFGEAFLEHGNCRMRSLRSFEMRGCPKNDQTRYGAMVFSDATDAKLVLGEIGSLRCTPCTNRGGGGLGICS